MLCQRVAHFSVCCVYFLRCYFQHIPIFFCAGDFLPIPPIVLLLCIANIHCQCQSHLLLAFNVCAVYLNDLDNTNTTNTSFSASNIVLSCPIRFTCRQRCVKRQAMPMCC